jgi:hypothetical protein
MNEEEKDPLLKTKPFEGRMLNFKVVKKILLLLSSCRDWENHNNAILEPRANKPICSSINNQTHNNKWSNKITSGQKEGNHGI